MNIAEALSIEMMGPDCIASVRKLPLQAFQQPAQPGDKDSWSAEYYLLAWDGFEKGETVVDRWKQNVSTLRVPAEKSTVSLVAGDIDDLGEPQTFHSRWSFCTRPVGLCPGPGLVERECIERAKNAACWLSLRCFNLIRTGARPATSDVSLESISPCQSSDVQIKHSNCARAVK